MSSRIRWQELVLASGANTVTIPTSKHDDDDDLIVTGYAHKDRSMTWAVHKPRKRPATVETTDEHGGESPRSFMEAEWKTNKAKATRKKRATKT